MKKHARPTLIALGIVVVGFHLGTGHAQRYTSKAPIPGSKQNWEVPTDFDVWKWVGSEDQHNRRFDPTAWRAQIKEELVLAKPTPRSVAEQKRGAARRYLNSCLAEISIGRTSEPSFLLDATDACVEAELTLCTTKEDRVKVLEMYWGLLKTLENTWKKAIDEDKIYPNTYYPLLHGRLKLEHDLVKTLAE